MISSYQYAQTDLFKVWNGDYMKFGYARVSIKAQMFFIYITSNAKLCFNFHLGFPAISIFYLVAFRLRFPLGIKI